MTEETSINAPLYLENRKERSSSVHFLVSCLRHYQRLGNGCCSIASTRRIILFLTLASTLISTVILPASAQDATKDASVRNRSDCAVWLANDAEEQSAVLCQAGDTCRVWFSRNYTVYHVNPENGHFGEQITRTRWNIVLTGKCPNVTATESW